MTRAIGVALLLTVTAFSSMQAEDKKADPTGTWKWTVTRNNQSRDVTLKLKLEGDKLSGSMPGRDNTEVAIDDASFKDNEITFSVTREFNGNKFTTKYKGKLDGDTIKGTTESVRDGQTRTRDWEAKRDKDAK